MKRSKKEKRLEDWEEKVLHGQYSYDGPVKVMNFILYLILIFFVFLMNYFSVLFNPLVAKIMTSPVALP